MRIWKFEKKGEKKKHNRLKITLKNDTIHAKKKTEEYRKMLMEMKCEFHLNVVILWVEMSIKQTMRNRMIYLRKQQNKLA